MVGEGGGHANGTQYCHRGRRVGLGHGQDAAEGLASGPKHPAPPQPFAACGSRQQRQPFAGLDRPGDLKAASFTGAHTLAHLVGIEKAMAYESAQHFNALVYQAA